MRRKVAKRNQHGVFAFEAIEIHRVVSQAERKEVVHSVECGIGYCHDTLSGVLCSPAGYEALQEALLAKSSENAARESSVATLVAMGFGRAAATALKTANGDLQAAAAALSDAAPAAEPMATDDAAASAGGGDAPAAAPKLTEEDHRAIESSGLHAALAASQAAYEAPALAVEGAAIEVYVAAVEEPSARLEKFDGKSALNL